MDKLMLSVRILDYVVNLVHLVTIGVLNMMDYDDATIDLYCLGALILTFPLIGLIVYDIVSVDPQKIRVIVNDSFEVSCNYVAVSVVVLDIMFIYSYILLIVDMSYWYIIFESIIIVVNVFANVEIIGY